MENPIKMDDLGVPLFLETPIYESLSSGDDFLQWCHLKFRFRFTRTIFTILFILLINSLHSQPSQTKKLPGRDASHALFSVAHAANGPSGSPEWGRLGDSFRDTYEVQKEKPMPKN